MLSLKDDLMEFLLPILRYSNYQEVEDLLHVAGKGRLRLQKVNSSICQGLSCFLQQLTLY